MPDKRFNSTRVPGQVAAQLTAFLLTYLGYTDYEATPAMRTSLCQMMLAAALAGCGTSIGDYDGTADRYTGADARSRIDRLGGVDGKALPSSARNFYLFDGGTFNGSITYVSFDCGNSDDCFSAIAAFGGPEKAEFKKWTHSHYAVVMNGPGFYFRSLASDPWNVRDITNGMVYENVRGGNRDMTYFAIDLDRNRVYYHNESGGFPDDVYQPKQ